ncbi:MAG: hypothetical protein WC977_10835, partial [Anaerovoracaceae bacterium]
MESKGYPPYNPHTTQFFAHFSCHYRQGYILGNEKGFRRTIEALILLGWGAGYEPRRKAPSIGSSAPSW